MALLDITSGQLSAILTIISEMILVPISGLILSGITAIIYNLAFTRGQSLLFGKSRHPFDWARKLRNNLSIFLLLSTALFLKSTVSVFPAIAESDFKSVLQRQVQNFSSPIVAARYNLLSSFGSFVGDDRYATYQTILSCADISSDNWTEFYAIQLRNSSRPLCLKGTDSFPSNKSAEYYLTQPSLIDPDRIKTFTVRLTNYTEVDSPTSKSTILRSGRTTETVGVFSMSVSTPEADICEGSAVRVYHGYQNMSVKVFGICDFSRDQRPENPSLNRVFIQYVSESLYDDLSGTSEISYTAFNGTVRVNESTTIAMKSNFPVLTDERMRFYDLNGRVVRMTSDRIRRMVTFVRPNVERMSGTPGSVNVYYRDIYRVTPLVEHSIGEMRTGALREYTQVGSLAVWAISCMLLILAVSLLSTAFVTWGLSRFLNTRFSMHTEQGLVLHVLSAMQQLKGSDVPQEVENLLLETEEGSGQVTIRLGQLKEAYF